MVVAGLFSLTVFLAAGGQGSGQPADGARERALDAFFDVANFDDMKAALEAINKSGITFDEAYARLQEGRTYSKDVPTGVVLESRRDAGRFFYYSLDVPADYDPGRRYPVRIHLHGGVGARQFPGRRGTGAIGALAGDEPQIYILPTAWARAPWWSDDQLANLRVILAIVKRAYNIDENRVSVSGVSDGGSGAFYTAMRDTTPYASFLPLIGSMMVLGNPDDGLADLYPNNLLAKPFFVVNGGRDDLYPTADVTPIVRYLRQGGVSVDYHPQPDAGHDTSFWPVVKDSFVQFEREHPRNPLPDTLTWQCGIRDFFCRAHWLLIDRLTPDAEPEMQPNVNVVPMSALRQFGISITGNRVLFIRAGSTAEKIGLARFDVIEAINGVPVGDDMDAVMGQSIQPGASMTLAVSRDNKPLTLNGVYEPSKELASTMTLLPRRDSRSGRVDLVKTGNTVRATTAGVAAYTLLISPDAFDFEQPITVITNGQVSFTGRVEKDLPTLLKWAARDDDRTMLFGAEIQVQVN